MKIGILTFHFAHNYGAMLQAYALSTKLNDLGYDAEIVDYRLPHIYRSFDKYSLLGLLSRYREDNNLILAVLKTLKNYFNQRTKDEKWNRFEDFSDLYFKKSNRIYNDNISTLNYDVVICGSDQIWNEHLTGYLLPFYFGATAPLDCKRISYAASNGSEIVQPKNQKQFFELLNRMDAVSVREEGLADFIKEKSNRFVDTVVDPAFLLPKEKWCSIAKEPVEQDYILTYSFNEDDLFFETVDKVAKMLGKKVLRFCFSTDIRANKCISQVTNGGPEEFLGFFKNASYVVTNSFHGTAFSLIFQKQFLCVPPLKNRKRLDNLLSMVELSNRIVSSSDNVDKSIIDYSSVTEILQSNIDTSVNYLKSSIPNN